MTVSVFCIHLNILKFTSEIYFWNLLPIICHTLIKSIFHFWEDSILINRNSVYCMSSLLWFVGMENTNTFSLTSEKNL